MPSPAFQVGHPQVTFPALQVPATSKAPIPTSRAAHLQVALANLLGGVVWCRDQVAEGGENG